MKYHTSITAIPFDVKTNFQEPGWTLFPNRRYRKDDPDIFEEPKLVRKVDFKKVGFFTGIDKDNHGKVVGSPVISGSDKLRRLKDGGNILYRADVFWGTWINYLRYRETSTLEFLWREKQIDYVSFVGDFLINQEGHRFILCLERYNGGWWNWDRDSTERLYTEKHFTVHSVNAT